MHHPGNEDSISPRNYTLGSLVAVAFRRFLCTVASFRLFELIRDALTESDVLPVQARKTLFRESEKK